MTDSQDVKIAAFLATPEREADELFVGRVAQAVWVEERLRAARQQMWRKFAFDAAACFIVALAFILLGSYQVRLADEARVPFFGPTAAGFVLLAVWAAVALRPGTARP